MAPVFSDSNQEGSRAGAPEAEVAEALYRDLPVEADAGEVLHVPRPGRHQGGGLRPGQDHGGQAAVHRPLLPQQDGPGGPAAIVLIYIQHLEL